MRYIEGLSIFANMSNDLRIYAVCLWSRTLRPTGSGRDTRQLQVITIDTIRRQVITINDILRHHSRSINTIVGYTCTMMRLTAELHYSSFICRILKSSKICGHNVTMDTDEIYIGTQQVS